MQFSVLLPWNVLATERVALRELFCEVLTLLHEQLTLCGVPLAVTSQAFPVKASQPAVDYHFIAHSKLHC